MGLDKQRLQAGILTISQDENGFFPSGNFVDLTWIVHLARFQIRKLQRLYDFLLFIERSLADIETIALRLAWQKTLYAQNVLSKMWWILFVKGDIELFHVKLRSIFDYVAKSMKFVAGSPAQVPESFYKLKSWAAKSHGNAHRLGSDLADALSSCEWFDDLRFVRDSILHRGGWTMVFPEPYRILFQVSESNGNAIQKPELMFNENVADFELYAGLYLGYSLAYLEEVASIIHRRLDQGGTNLSGGSHQPGLSVRLLTQLPPDDLRARSYHPGLSVVREWVERVLKHCDADNS
jgi:hypothetical protein